MYFQFTTLNIYLTHLRLKGLIDFNINKAGVYTSLNLEAHLGRKMA
jgi:hypothetical protein